MLDTITSPWPAFVLASNYPLSDMEQKKFYQSIDTCIYEFKKNFTSHGLPLIMNNSIFHYPNQDDVLHWFENVEFVTSSRTISRNVIQFCVDTLVEAKLIDATALKQWESKGTKIVDAICYPSIEFL